MQVFLGLLLALLSALCDASTGRQERSSSFMASFKHRSLLRVNKLLRRKVLSGGMNLIEAAAEGKVGAVQRILMNPTSDPAAKNSLALRKACQKGYSQTVQALLKDGRADPCACHQMIFRHAILKGQYKILKLLLEDGRIDPQAAFRRLIRSDDLQSDAKIFRLLSDDGRVDMSTEANACLYEAFTDEDLEAAEVLLESPNVRRLFILTLANSILNQGCLGSALASQYHFVKQAAGLTGEGVIDTSEMAMWREALELFRPQRVHAIPRHISVWKALKRVDNVFVRLNFAETEVLAGKLDEYNLQKEEDYFIKQALKLKRGGCAALYNLVETRLGFMTFVTVLWSRNLVADMQDLLPIIEAKLYTEIQ